VAMSSIEISIFISNVLCHISVYLMQIFSFTYIYFQSQGLAKKLQLYAWLISILLRNLVFLAAEQRTSNKLNRQFFKY